MINYLELTNFKAFNQASLNLKPLTFILGPNNSGKSSIISAIRMLVQTVESYDTNVPLLLNGILGDFGTYKDIVHGNHRARKLGIKFTVVGSRGYELITLDLNFKFRINRREIILKSSELFGDGTSMLKTEYAEDSEKQLIQKIGNRVVPSKLKSSLSRSIRFHNFMPTRMYLPFVERSATSEFITEAELKKLRDIGRIAADLNRQLRDVEYVGAIRAYPSRTFLYSGENRARVGANGQFAASILALDSARGGKKSKKLITKIKNWLTKSEMASDIKIVPITDRHYEIKIQHSTSEEYQNFADVGFGHSQILPILVAGYNSRPLSTLLVEQPEIHLHPKAQAELGDFFLDLYRDGVQSIVETHSEHLILRLQQHVIKGEISPDDIVFYYVGAGNDGKFITELKVDQEGKFIADWPEGFFPERLNESKEIAKLRFQKKYS